MQNFVSDILNFLSIIIYFLRENKSSHFMWIICLTDDSHEMSRLYSLKKKVKLFSAAIVIGALRVNKSRLMTSWGYALLQKVMSSLSSELETKAEHQRFYLRLRYTWFCLIWGNYLHRGRRVTSWDTTDYSLALVPCDIWLVVERYAGREFYQIQDLAKAMFSLLKGISKDLYFLGKLDD